LERPEGEKESFLKICSLNEYDFTSDWRGKLDTA